jgi:hypothetical protein
MSDQRVEIGSPLDIQELEPSPIEDTPKDSAGNSYFPPASPQPRTSTSFLGLGDHGPVFYCMQFPLKLWLKLTRSSDQNTEVFQLRFLGFWPHSCHEYSHNSSHYPIGFRFRHLSSTHTTIIPIKAPRATSSSRSFSFTHHFGNSPSNISSKASSCTLWGKFSCRP